MVLTFMWQILFRSNTRIIKEINISCYTYLAAEIERKPAG